MKQRQEEVNTAVRIPGLVEIFFGRLANFWRARRQARRQNRRTPQFQSLEPRVLLSADLVGTVHWDPAAPLFPGAEAEAVVLVQNFGDASAKSAKVSVYASADDVLDASDILLGRDSIHGKLKPGGAQEVEVDLDFDTALPPGEYRLIAHVDSGDRVHESDETNNTALGPVFDFSWMFGDLPGHHGSEKLRFVDADGTKVTLRLHGEGTGVLTWDGSGWDLLVSGTDEHSVLTIQTNGRGDGRFAIDDLHVAGPLAGLFAPRTDLTGTLAMDEALRAGMVIGGASGAIIAVPTITGLGGHKFGLQGIAILGDLENSQILIGADLGADGQPGGAGEDADSYGGGELGKLVIGGSMLSSEVRVGQDPVDGIFDNGNDAFFGGADSSIDAVLIRGEMSADSLVVAGALPFKAFVDHHKIRVADDPRFRLHDADFNQAPDAVDDPVTTDEDTEVTIAVLANDTDADGDGLTVQSVGTAGNGLVLLNLDGTVTYSPDPDFFGADSFTYTISDGQGGTDTATVTVTVNPVNDPPVLDPIDDQAVLQGATLTFLATAGDVDNAPADLTFSLDAGAPAGATIDPTTGAFEWTPAAPGDFLVTVRVTDAGGLDDFETFAVSVAALPEISIGDVALLEGDAGNTVAQFQVTLSAPAPADLSVDYFTLNGTAIGEEDYVSASGTLFIAQGGTGGLIEVQVIGDTVVEPDETFQVRLTTPVNAVLGDAFGDGTILNDDVNQAPVAGDDTATTSEDTAVTIDVLANDSDADGDGLTVQSVGAAANGSVVINGDSTVTYTPAPNFFGGDSFTYTISDGAGGVDTASVAVTVLPVNDPPVALDDTGSTDEDTTTLIDLLINDTDVDGDTLTLLSINGQAAVVDVPIALPSGALVTQQFGGAVLYDPNGAFEALNIGGSAGDSFTYVVGDGNGGTDSAVATITLAGVDDAPIAQDDTSSTNEDSAVLVNVLANDFDVDDAVLTVISINGQAPVVGNTIVLASGAQLTPQADGTYLYDPNGQFESLAAGDVAADSFTYVIDDGHGLTDGATATISIGGVNDAPVLGAIGDRTVDEGTALTFTATAGDPDDAPAALTFSLDAGAPAGSTIDPVTGEFSWTPTEAQGPGTYDITVRVSDDGTPSLVDFETIQVTVNEVNQAPVLDAIETIYTLANSSFGYQITASDPDLPTNGLTFSLVGPPVPNASISSSGLFEWTTTPSAIGSTFFTVLVEDDGGMSAQQMFEVRVIDKPLVAIDDAMAAEGGASPAEFRIMLSGPAPIQGVTVGVTNAGGGATAGTDYILPSSNTVTLAHRDTEQSFVVQIVDDGDTESDEVFALDLALNPTNATLSTKTRAIGTILDNESPLHVAVGRETVFEGNGEPVSAEFVVMLSEAAGSAITVNYSTTNGTASNTVDFTAVTGSLLFAAGETEKTVLVPILGDAGFEFEKNFRLVISSPDGTIPVLSPTNNGTIVNDDPIAPMVAASVGEAAPAPAPAAADLQATLDTAVELWANALGTGDPRLALLDGLTIALTDFAGTGLGATSGNTILIDTDAAGHGWYVDLTPAQNEEFRAHSGDGALFATPRSEAFGSMDLLTVVLHEIGHVLGFDHEDAAQYAVMRDQLDAGTRYTLDAPKFDFDAHWAGGTGASIAWEDWGIQWMPAHKPRGGHAGPHLPGFLVRL